MPLAWWLQLAARQPRHVHQWTDKCRPIACAVCGKTQTPERRARPN